MNLYHSLAVLLWQRATVCLLTLPRLAASTETAQGFLDERLHTST